MKDYLNNIILFCLLNFTLLNSSCVDSKKESHAVTEESELIKNFKDSSCALTIDTFEFKGIRIGNHLRSLDKIYSIAPVEFRYYRCDISDIQFEPILPPQFKSYEIKFKKLSILGYPISKIYVSTYNDYIFGIDIYMKKDSNEISYFNDLIRMLAVRYNAISCFESTEKGELLYETILLKLMNDKLAIIGFLPYGIIDPQELEKYLPRDNSKSNKEKHLNKYNMNNSDVLIIQITDLKTNNIYESECDKIIYQKNLKDKNDF